MSSILIAGPAKSGTTALYSSAKDNLPNCVPVFEPCRSYQFDFISRKIIEGEQVVSKIIYPNVELDSFNFSCFDKCLVVARDPRDMLVSWLLYVSFLSERYQNKEYRKKFIKLLKKKESDPASVSILEIVQLMKDYGFELKSTSDFQDDLEGAKYLLDKYPDSFLIKYEDFIAGKVSDLNFYTGLELGSDTKVSDYVKYNSRAKSSGNWRHWFTAEDVEFFRPLMLEYMTYFGYEDEWQLAENPEIQAKVSSKYVQRYFKRLKKLPNRFGLLRSEADYTKQLMSHLSSAANNGAEGAMIELGLAALYGYHSEKEENDYEYWINKAIKYGSPTALVHLGVAIEARIIEDNRTPAQLFGRAGELLGNAAAKRAMQEIRRMYHLNDPVRFANILDSTVSSLHSAQKEVARHVAQKTHLENKISALETEFNDNQKQLEDNKAQVSSLQHELSKSRQQIGSAQDELSKLQGELTKTNQHYTDACADLERLEKDLVSREENQRKLYTQNSELSSGISALETKVTSVRAKEAGLREQLSQRNHENQTLSHELELKNKKEALLRKSISYQFISHTRNAFSSFTGFIRYPLALSRLFKRWYIRRKAARKNHNLNQSSNHVLHQTQPSQRQTLRDKEVLHAHTLGSSDQEVKPLQQRVNYFLDKFVARTDIKNLLYADISLDVIDGSSIWFTSMANILAEHGETVVLLKSKPSHDHLTNNLTNSNISVITANDFDEDVLSITQATNVISLLDNRMPNLNCIVVRGLDAACSMHASRQFKKRTALYLTDFYSYGEGGRGSTKVQMNKVQSIRDHAGIYLVQTAEIKSALELLAGTKLNTHLLPPPLPVMPDAVQKINSTAKGKALKFVYAGKVTPEWGVIELLDCIELLRSHGVQVTADVITNKITAKEHARFFRGSIIKRFKDLEVNLIDGLPRQEVFKYLQAADFVWCWRPAALELSTIELSTKLIEAVALGCPAITYPSKTNKQSLGEDYPYFLSDPKNITKLVVDTQDHDLDDVVNKLQTEHGFSEISNNFKSVLPVTKPRGSKLLFASHDWKFIDAYISSLKGNGNHVDRDNWEWGEAEDIKRSELMYQNADIIFCEWGLANAVWYAARNTENKPLFIRLHAQEVRDKARKFGAQIDINNVTKAIFVSETVRQAALALWDWPIEKTLVIPNFVMDDEYKMTGHHKIKKQKVVLGMVGIVPSLKRFDRAISLLEKLEAQGMNVELRIKGHRPENLDFMRAPGRKGELDYYYEQYERLDSDPELKAKVTFDPFGNDVAQWYQEVDYILSCSDSESFHYALADGVLSGCLPLVWPWEGSENMYPSDWLVNDFDAAIKRMVVLQKLPENELNEVLAANRKYVVKHYGQEIVFASISAEVFKSESQVKHLNVVRQTA